MFSLVSRGFASAFGALRPSSFVATWWLRNTAIYRTGAFARAFQAFQLRGRFVATVRSKTLLQSHCCFESTAAALLHVCTCATWRSSNSAIGCTRAQTVLLAPLGTAHKVLFVAQEPLGAIQTVLVSAQEPLGATRTVLFAAQRPLGAAPHSTLYCSLLSALYCPLQAGTSRPRHRATPKLEQCF